jgi:hypothetical protein
MAVIHGDFYPGAYGPTILLEAQELIGVDWFLRKLVELSRDECAAFDLAAMPEASLEHVSELRLETVEIQPKPALIRDGDRFTWRQDTLRWAHASMLIEPLLKGGAGHQYLTHEGVDDALVEFSVGENLGVGTR